MPQPSAPTPSTKFFSPRKNRAFRPIAWGAGSRTGVVLCLTGGVGRHSPAVFRGLAGSGMFREHRKKRHSRARRPHAPENHAFFRRISGDFPAQARVVRPGAFGALSRIEKTPERPTGPGTGDSPANCRQTTGKRRERRSGACRQHDPDFSDLTNRPRETRPRSPERNQQAGENTVSNPETTAREEPKTGQCREVLDGIGKGPQRRYRGSSPFLPPPATEQEA